MLGLVIIILSEAMVWKESASKQTWRELDPLLKTPFGPREAHSFGIAQQKMAEKSEADKRYEILAEFNLLCMPA